MGEASAVVARRLHLSVGPNSFLPTLLRVRANGTGEFLFGEAQLHELLTLLKDVVPPKLAVLMQQKTPTRDVIDGVSGDTLTATLMFMPTSSAIWLLGGSGEQSDGHTRKAVEYTLLCDVRPL